MKTIYTLGYPKSGSTWLSRLLGDTLNSPVGGIRPDDDTGCIATEGQDRPGPYYIRQGHAVPGSGDTLTPGRHIIALEHLTDERIVIMLRDPRDVAVSAAHHWGRSLDEALHCMGKGLWPIPHGGGWCEWVRAWMEVASNCKPWILPRKRFPLYMSYEYLTADTFVALQTVTDYMTDCEFDGDIETSIIRQSFDTRRAYTEQHGDALNYGKEFQLRFLRKGVVGDWRNHFTSEHRRLAEGYFGEMMRELGYTKDETWVNE